ncbi:MAG: hypothetical protein JW821_15405 [Deltaproteobacteria bacterium]|nr:hypothetical protein [Deltaproteobacteria bacterium]
MRCLYCGAIQEEGVLPAGGESASGREGGGIVSFEVRGVQRRYASLEDLPPDLREKVEQALGTGGTYTEPAGDGEGFSGGGPASFAGRTPDGLKPQVGDLDAWVFTQFLSQRSKRRKPFSRSILLLVALLSMVLGGGIVWLLG